MNINETVYIVDVVRWNEFVTTCTYPTIQTFHNSAYYLHDCLETDQTFLVELGKDNNIAIVHNKQGFLASVSGTKPKSLRDVFGKVSAGLPSESIDNCVRMHLDQHDQYPMIEIHSRTDEHGNAIDDDDTLAAIAASIATQWNNNNL